MLSLLTAPPQPLALLTSSLELACISTLDPSLPLFFFFYPTPSFLNYIPARWRLYLLPTVSFCSVSFSLAPIPRSHLSIPLYPQQLLLLFLEALLNDNRTLRWHSQPGAGSAYLSQGLRYNDDKNELVVDHAGLYYVSLQLKLNPVSKNMDHKVRGQVSLVLQLNPRVNDLDSWTLTVDLFPCSMEANLVEGSRSDLIHLKAGHRLSVELRAYLHGVQGASDDWQLSQTDTTSFVLFLVKPGTS